MVTNLSLCLLLLIELVGVGIAADSGSYIGPKRKTRIIFSTTISFPANDGSNGLSYVPFVLRFKDICRWRDMVSEFGRKYNVDQIALGAHVMEQLTNHGIPDDIIHNLSHTLDRGQHVDTSDVSFVQFNTAVAHNSWYFSERNNSGRQETLQPHFPLMPLFVGANYKTQPMKDMFHLQCSLPDLDVDTVSATETTTGCKAGESRWPSFLHSQERQHLHTHVVIYQNPNADTGGTIALALLRDHIHSLGYRVIMCTEHNIETEDRCKHPRESDLVITGEWCNGVMADYNITFRGRGLQYHLGFHHHDDTCKGHITIADSHFLTTVYEHRIVGAYFLGCPMTNFTREIFLDIIRGGNPQTLGVDAKDKPTIFKENLLLVDPDMWDDYPPEVGAAYQFPAHIQVMFAKNIPRSALPMYLLRAKAVLDLALPGPERLSSECALLGCVPIISNRWNGASRIDFPAIRRVDHTNITEVFEAVVDVFNNYHELVAGEPNTIFYSYILSMWPKLHHTTDIVIGSSNLHFLLSAHTLAQEHILTLRVLALLYFYPLASVTVFVRDVRWFVRHHYVFVSIMTSCGYMRVDPMDPEAHIRWNSRTAGTSFVNINSLYQLELHLATVADRADSSSSFCDNGQDGSDPFNLCPPWQPVTVVLGPIATFNSHINGMMINDALVFRNPFVLMHAIHTVTPTEIRTLHVRTGHNPDFRLGFFMGPDSDLRMAVTHIAAELLLSSSLAFSTAEGVATSTTVGSQDMAPICSLLHFTPTMHGNTGSSKPDSIANDYYFHPTTHADVEVDGEEYLHVFNLTDTVPWLRLVSHIKKTTGLHSLCNQH